MRISNGWTWPLAVSALLNLSGHEQQVAFDLHRVDALHRRDTELKVAVVNAVDHHLSHKHNAHRLLINNQ